MLQSSSLHCHHLNWISSLRHHETMVDCMNPETLETNDHMHDLYLLIALH